jgi:L-ascorbate metabolism protein UlaG (beta-lactamase superfamily)
MKKALKLFTRMMIIIFSVLALLALVVFAYMQHPKFGAKATGKRLERMQASPHYKDGVFDNHSFTPTITEGYSMTKVMFDFLFRKGSNTVPKGIIPSVQTDLNKLQGDWLVWFGHSSYYMQTDGLRILVDPVFSGNASPIQGTTKAFKGTDPYSVADMPPIDYLLISHDHYDHLDYETILQLKGKVKKVVCGLGVGAHLELWGFAPENIIELDWDTDIALENGGRLYGHTARHFSGRGFKRNNTLWISYLLQTPTRKIFIGGDSGYDRHFKEIGALHGPIDLAILENGQYNVAWKAIHFLPGENLQAALELKAKRLMPVHSGKFSLALHSWDEPLREMVRRNQQVGLPLVTPKIGEPVSLSDTTQVFTEWWKDVDKAAQ